MRGIIVDDDTSVCTLIKRQLENGFGNIDVETYGSIEDLSTRVAGGGCAGLPDFILLDLGLPGIRGIDGVRKVVASFRDVPVIVITGVDDNGLAIEAIREGAADFISKTLMTGPLIVQRIKLAVERVELARASSIMFRAHSKLESINLELAKTLRKLESLSVGIANGS